MPASTNVVKSASVVSPIENVGELSAVDRALARWNSEGENHGVSSAIQHFGGDMAGVVEYAKLYDSHARSKKNEGIFSLYVIDEDKVRCEPGCFSEGYSATGKPPTKQAGAMRISAFKFALENSAELLARLFPAK